jgi:hypothetical protein
VTYHEVPQVCGIARVSDEIRDEGVLQRSIVVSSSCATMYTNPISSRLSKISDQKMLGQEDPMMLARYGHGAC